MVGRFSLLLALVLSAWMMQLCADVCPARAQEVRWPEAAAAMATRHPSELMLKAPALLAENKGDEATFWFYAGQLRYRSYLAAHPDLDPTGDPALFSALLDTIGRPVNAFAFGDIPGLARTIDAVLLWDRRYPDPSLPAATHEVARAGLDGLRAQILSTATTIRKEREANGLINR